MEKNEIEYVVVNIAENSKYKDDFFNWALEHRLFQTQSDTRYTSRMKTVYTKRKATGSLTSVIAIKDGKPIGMLLSENIDKSYPLYTYQEKNNRWLKDKDTNAEMIVMGFLSFYVKDRYRRQGISGKMMDLLENEKLTNFFALKNENKHSLMVFEAREKALLVIKNKAQYAYDIDTDERDFSFLKKSHNFSLHALAVMNNDTKSMAYDNSLFIKKKTHPLLEEIKEKQQSLSKISVKSLIEKTPLPQKKEEVKKIIKKIPTLKPRGATI